jgi:hypothetical protein
MSNGMFAVALAIGAALLAVWIDARFADSAPRTLQRVFAHALAALVLMQLIPGSGNSVLFGFVVVFGAALPAFVYAFLVAIWIMRLWLSSGLQR